MYLKLAAVACALLLLAGENWWVYRKGQASIITNVVSASSVIYEKDNEKAKQDVAHATADTQTLTNLTAERNALRKRLASAPKIPPASNCVLSDDELLSLQRAAGSEGTK